MFATTGNGFHIGFPNGWHVSVQWGGGTYSDNHRASYTTREHLTSQTAEVACWQGEKGIEDVTGYLTPTEVAAFITEVASR